MKAFERGSVLTDALLQIVADIVMNFKKIVAVSCMMLFLVFLWAKEVVTYQIVVNNGLCVYELKCNKVGFVYFSDLLMVAIANEPGLKYIAWNKFALEIPFFSGTEEMIFDEVKINNKIRENLTEHYENLIDRFEYYPLLEQISNDFFVDEIIYLSQNIKFLRPPNKVFHVVNIREISALEYLKQRSVFVFIFSTCIVLFWMRVREKLSIKLRK